MKKTSVLLLVLFIIAAFALTACSVAEPPNAPPAEPPAPAQSDEAATVPEPGESAEPETVTVPVNPPEAEPEPIPESMPETEKPTEPEIKPDDDAEPAPETETETESVPETLPDAEPAPETPTPEEPSEEPQEEEGQEGEYHEKVPIFMYHEVNDLLINSLYLSVEDFTAHLDYFEEAGITPISMQQLYDHWFNGAPVPEKPVVLTFDDGYSSMYTTVYPLLKERGWSGTFYCITGTRWTEGHLTEEEIAEMAENGMEIGSHTVSHLELNSLSSGNLEYELTLSKEELYNITGKDIAMLCYPAGRYNEATKTAAREANYLSAVTTQYGFASKSQGMFDLKRIRVSTDCGAAWMESVLSQLGY